MGIGGRLGWMAQCACSLQFLTLTVIAVGPLWNDAGRSGSITGALWTTNHQAVLSSMTVTGVLATCLWTVAGAVCMNGLQEFLGHRAAATPASSSSSSTTTTTKIQGWYLAGLSRLATTVGATSLTGLVGVLIQRAVTRYGWQLAGPWYCGSFVAMSAPHILLTYGDLISASILSGLIQSFLMPWIWLGGWGGKLGSAAFLAVLAYQKSRRRTVEVKQ